MTRSRILDAIVRIVATNVTGLSVEAVARQAEVSRPTVYRYFRNKREMVDAVLQRYAERVGTAATVSATSLDEVADQIPAIFAHWEALEPELRAAAAALHRAEERSRFLPERLAAVRRVLEPYSNDLSKADRERLARVTLILFSSGMADVLNRCLGASATEAADLVVWAVNRLVRTGRRRPVAQVMGAQGGPGPGHAGPKRNRRRAQTRPSPGLGTRTDVRRPGGQRARTDPVPLTP
ncbi:MAG: helix-turn-helix domain-containing protein [Chloroflexota bacterium]